MTKSVPPARLYGDADPDSDTRPLSLSEVLEVQRRLAARKAEDASHAAWRLRCARKQAAKVVGEVVALAWLINVWSWLS
ncbi:MAG TPA: hypothetical protein VGK73_31535 [Polyangiaceae bacterium]